jgi:hypothetical protein
VPKLAATESRRRSVSVVMIAAIACLAGSTAPAQYRSNQPAVMTPPVTQPRAASNTVEEFEADYRAAGRPRVSLFWNVAFDDSTETERQNIDRTQRSRSESSSDLNTLNSGVAGDATAREQDQKSTEVVDHTTSSRPLVPAKRAVPLDTVTAVELEAAFRRQLQVAGVRLINRDFNIRITQADLDRGAIDPKLIEADAVSAHSDWLLEILMVPDARTVLGIGFKVTVTGVNAGTELLSIYTAANPQVASLPSYYVATASGFELRQPTRQLSADDVGVSLAREIMESLRPLLAPKRS